MDNTGTPIAATDTTIQFGTFTDAFAATLNSQDPWTKDQTVINAFIPSGPTGTFILDGIFNLVLQTDESGALGNAVSNNDAYVLITWIPNGGHAEALVISMGQEFPEHVDNEATLTLDRTINAGDIAFGGYLATANTSNLPGAFRPFTEGIGIAQGASFPEPSTSLFSFIACFSLLVYRQR